MARVIVVSNRLPVTVGHQSGRLVLRDSAGGVATGLVSLRPSFSSTWIGWPGIDLPASRRDDREWVERELGAQDCVPVYLSRADIEKYYHGFSNETLWPLFHYSEARASFRADYWESYLRVNRLFADAVAGAVRTGDSVWVHDYHLMLLPALLRRQMRSTPIGFFLHIPFPSSETFRMLPWRHEILEGLIGADLVGFHTYNYARHFLSSVRRILGHEHETGRIKTGPRSTVVDAFPMGIGFDRYADAVRREGATRGMKQLGDRRVVLSIDRLDYTKGIVDRLKAYDLFLQTHPEWHNRVVLVALVVPSRSRIPEYARLKEQVDEAVGRINGRYAVLGWAPIHYMYRSFGFKQLVSLYHRADVALVTPLRDGMNLVAKEFVATRTDARGVLVLSEMAGAAEELSEALLVNPRHQQEVANAIARALTMPAEEQVVRIRKMQERLQRYDVRAWAEDFLDRLRQTARENRGQRLKKLARKTKQDMIKAFLGADRCLVLLDYDGTLVPFAETPDKARPDRALLRLLRKLSRDARTETIVVSGRPRSTLEEWFRTLDVGLVAEHGVWFRKPGEEWQTFRPLRDDWKTFLRPVFERWVTRTPKSLLEEKDFSLVWHYRQVDSDLAAARLGELKSVIADVAANEEVEVVDGNKVLELRSAGTGKGHAVRHWLTDQEWDFIMAVGDDTTDEDMFRELPDEAWTVKVGQHQSAARFSLDSPRQVRALLGQMIG
jgi:trehalose 6-phosphate synthase/phosphatase